MLQGHSLKELDLRPDGHKGSGGNASGRAMAFCPHRPGSNPGRVLAFLVQNYCLSILTLNTKP